MSEPTTPWWQREGVIVRLLGAAGAGVLLIGVVLLLAFAIQHGYLGPAARVAGAGVLAAGLIGGAVRLHRDPARAAGAVAIAAAGYATAYLDVMAATVIYDWLPAPVGLALAGVVAASGVVLARAWDRQFLALITVGGVAALGPVLGDGATLLTAAFLVVLAIAAYPAQLGKSWLLLHLVRVTPAAGFIIAAAGTYASTDTGGSSYLGLGNRAAYLGLAALLAAFELTTCATTPTPSRVHSNPVESTNLDRRVDSRGREQSVATAPGGVRPDELAHAGTPAARAARPENVPDAAPTHSLVRPTLLNALLPVSAAALAATSGASDLPGWLVLALAALAYLGLAVTVRHRAYLEPVMRFAPWAGAVGTAFAVGAVVDGLGDNATPLGLAALAVAYAVASRSLDRLWTRVATVAILGLALLGVLPTFGALVNRADATTRIEWIDAAAAALVATAAVLALPTMRRLTAGLTEHRTRFAEITCLAIALAGASAAVIALAVVVGDSVDRPAGGFVVGHGLATLLWAAGAAYLLMHGLRRGRDAAIALRAGLLLAAAAVAKLLLFDLATLDGIVRIAAFIGAGLALLAMGTGYAKALERARAH